MASTTPPPFHVSRSAKRRPAKRRPAKRRPAKQRFAKQRRVDDGSHIGGVHRANSYFAAFVVAGLAVMVSAVAPASAKEPSSSVAPTVALTSASKFEKDVLSPRKGKIVVVNFWATWCAPCVKELPELEEAAKELKPEGIELVLVSADGKAAAAKRVPAFLTKKNITLPVFVNENVDPEEMINVVDKSWSGALPYTAFYDREGKRVSALAGAQTKASVMKAARALLAKSTRAAGNGTKGVSK